jgi:hypothetical protein
VAGASQHERTMRFEVVVDGSVGPMLRAALDDCRAEPGPAGRTRLLVELPDQTALRRVLQRLDDLHVQLVEVRRLSDDLDDRPEEI